MLRGWQAWYEYTDDRPDTPFFFIEDHAAFGLFIAERVKQLLPEWTVIYFDEGKYHESFSFSPMPDSSYYQYDITLDESGNRLT